MYKGLHSRTTFGSLDAGKVHAVVAGSTFPSRNAKNTTCPGNFWTFRCRKSARRCGAKRVSKSKCQKHHMFGPLLEQEGHVQAKMLKTLHVRTTFGRSDVVLHGRHTGFRTWSKVRKMLEFCSSLTYNHQYTTLHYNTLHYTPLHSTPLH